ncbi:ATP-binding protein [Neobacillus sp. WH10]|uniref:ATP-binding protein n=1 Tax=Neobacillus sp. WH10 TaxID=3047873 RepID=UPI0024C17BC7|nr:ATP-binding protein [Neobacillus sp. WH10]WHY77804.1 ATP-binding protein [Neobacillus sp. WH10]
MNLWNEGQELLKGVHCKAEYKEQIVEQNQGNPLIEAIPSRLDIEMFYDKLYSIPMFKTEHLGYGIEDRLELVQQIKPSFWLPLPSHYDKYRSLYNMLKIGYQSRNPVTAMYNRQFAIGWDKILETGLDENGANIAGNIQTAQSSTEIGLSGMGKSKVYERILKLLFPQVIHHSEYKGRILLTTQVVWLKIECPSGKSIGALCKNFYAAVDDLLGSKFYEKHGEKGGTIDDLAKRMVKVAAQINLGVLIIDEIQNVHKAHSGGDERMINFITELVNTIGIPVIVIGTFKAMYLYKKSLAVSRRGIPDMYNENVTSLMLEDSWEWNEFIQNLWDLQYTAKYTTLTDDLKKAMYYQTLGIPDIAVKLFMHVQAKAILNGEDEKITVSLLNDVASKSLRLLQPIFEKIRRGSSISLLDELDDVHLEWDSFNDYFKQASHRINLYGKVAKDHSRVNQQKNKDSIINELVQFALNLVSSTELAESLALTVFQASEGMGDKSNMFAHLAQLVLAKKLPSSVTNVVNQVSGLPKSTKPKKIKPLLEQGDIRFIVSEGLKKGLTTEESLFEAGLVKEYDELLNII